MTTAQDQSPILSPPLLQHSRCWCRRPVRRPRRRTAACRRCKRCRCASRCAAPCPTAGSAGRPAAPQSSSCRRRPVGMVDRMVRGVWLEGRYGPRESACVGGSRQPCTAKGDENLRLSPPHERSTSLSRTCLDAVAHVQSFPELHISLHVPLLPAIAHGAGAPLNVGAGVELWGDG
jgi:hypothetical protein